MVEESFCIICSVLFYIGSTVTNNPPRVDHDHVSSTVVRQVVVIECCVFDVTILFINMEDGNKDQNSLDRLSYRELQSLAITLCIPANLKVNIFLQSKGNVGLLYISFRFENLYI